MILKKFLARRFLICMSSQYFFQFIWDVWDVWDIAIINNNLHRPIRPVSPIQPAGVSLPRMPGGILPRAEGGKTGDVPSQIRDASWIYPKVL